MTPAFPSRRRAMLGLAAAAAWPTAFAQTGFPSRPIRVLTPATGGTLDLVGRAILESAGRLLGQPVLLEPRPGANGILAARAVVGSPADGHTLLLMAGSALAINASVYRNPGYDTERDLMPIAQLAKTLGILLCVNASVPPRTVSEFIAYCRASPTPLNYASAGVGNLGHLAMEMFARKAGVKLVHVPYKSAMAQVNALLGGEVQISFLAGPPALPFLQSGQLRALAVAGADRLPQLPEVPTLAESGVEGVDSGAWVGLLARAGTPRDAVQAINHAVAESMARPEVRKAMQGLVGYEMQSSTPEQLAKMLSADVKRYADIVRAAGITPA